MSIQSLSTMATPVAAVTMEQATTHQEHLIKFYEQLGYKVTDEKIPFREEDKVRYILPEYQDQIYCAMMHKHNNS